jgi:hypothetical protein
MQHYMIQFSSAFDYHLLMLVIVQKHLNSMSDVSSLMYSSLRKNIKICAMSNCECFTCVLLKPFYSSNFHQIKQKTTDTSKTPPIAAAINGEGKQIILLNFDTHQHNSTIWI